jgi:hypothetical protein
VTDYGLDDRGSIRQRQRIFLLASVSRLALGPTQSAVQWVPEVKRGQGVTLTTHPHLVPRLRMSRSYTSSPWHVAGQLYFLLNSSIVHYFLIFTEVSVWHIKVISVSYTYIVDIQVCLKFFYVVHKNDNNESKNSLARGRILNFLNNSLHEALLLVPAIIPMIFFWMQNSFFCYCNLFSIYFLDFIHRPYDF